MKLPFEQIKWPILSTDKNTWVYMMSSDEEVDDAKGNFLRKKKTPYRSTAATQFLQMLDTMVPKFNQGASTNVDSSLYETKLPKDGVEALRSQTRQHVVNVPQLDARERVLNIESKMVSSWAYAY